MSAWSNQFPGVQQRPSNLQSSPALLSPAGDEAVRQVAQSRLKTPCELLEKKAGRSAFGGVSNETNIIVATTLCDVEPINATNETPPLGFANEVMYRVWMSAQISVNLNARLRVPGWLPQWTASHAFDLGAKVVPHSEYGNGHFYECVKAGSTGATEPIWDERRGATVTDGAAVWKESGDAFTLEVVLNDGERSRDSLVCVLCKLLK